MIFADQNHPEHATICLRLSDFLKLLRSSRLVLQLLNVLGDLTNLPEYLKFKFEMCLLLISKVKKIVD